MLRGLASARWIGMRIWERSHRGQKISLSRVTIPIENYSRAYGFMRKCSSYDWLRITCNIYIKHDNKQDRERERESEREKERVRFIIKNKQIQYTYSKFWITDGEGLSIVYVIKWLLTFNPISTLLYKNVQWFWVFYVNGDAVPNHNAWVW